MNGLCDILHQQLSLYILKSLKLKKFISCDIEETVSDVSFRFSSERWMSNSK